MMCPAGSLFAPWRHDWLVTASMQHPALASSSPVLHVLSQIADSLACRRALVCLGRTQSRDAAGSHLEVHMQMTLKTLLAVAAVGFATQAAAQITFYEGEGFRG